MNSLTSFILYLLLFGYSVSILAIEDDVTFSILACFPLPLSAFLMLKHFIYPMFNRREEDDYGIDVLGFLFSYFSITLGWAMVYMVFWRWDNTSFSNIDTDSSFLAFVYLLSTSIYTGSGTAAAHVLPEYAWVGLTTAIQLQLAWVTIGFIVASVIDFYKKKSSIKPVRGYNFQ